LEIGALLSIRTQDIPSFERYMAQLKAFYREIKYFTLIRDLIPESPRMYMLLGLNLLKLLAEVKYSEFHTELESIGSKNLKNIYINHPVSIEQALMEGSYNKIWNARQDVPAKEYAFFMDILMQTIR
jgi:26S proteasome regulatory subunit N12